MTDVERPLPQPSQLTQAFWDACKRGELLIQHCKACDRYRHYPQPMCAACHSMDWEWAPVSGRGVIHSYIVAHQAFHPHWADKVPYVVATIELEEGVRMVDDMLELDPEAVKIGARVDVFFQKMSEEITLPKFKLAG